MIAILNRFVVHARLTSFAVLLREQIANHGIA